MDGNPRIYGDAVDVGAYEFQADPLGGRETPSTVVTTAEDTVDPYDGAVSLREAVWYAKDVAAGTVTFDASLDGATIQLTNSPITVDCSVTIDASSLDSLTVDGMHRNRVFVIPAKEGREVAIDGLTIARGRGVSGGGDIQRRDTLAGRHDHPRLLRLRRSRHL